MWSRGEIDIRKGRFYMKFRLMSLPKFRAASSGVDKNFEFSSEGILGKFSDYFSEIKPMPRDDFMSRDF